jgi:hypothetical protein
VNGRLCTTVVVACADAVETTFCVETGTTAVSGGFACFPVPEPRWPEPLWPAAGWMARVGTGVPCGHVRPALVTAQFDAQVTPAAVTTHPVVPGQTSPALVRTQPGPAPDDGVPLVVGAVVVGAVVVAAAVVVVVGAVVVEDAVVVAEVVVVAADVVVVLAETCPVVDSVPLDDGRAPLLQSGRLVSDTGRPVLACADRLP